MLLILKTLPGAPVRERICELLKGLKHTGPAPRTGTILRQSFHTKMLSLPKFSCNVLKTELMRYKYGLVGSSFQYRYR